MKLPQRSLVEALGEAGEACKRRSAEALDTAVFLEALGGDILGTFATRAKLRPPRNDLSKYVSLPTGGQAQRVENLIPSRKLQEGEGLGATICQEVGDPLNPTENRLKRLVVSEDCLIKQLGTSVAAGHAAQGTVKHDAANGLAQRDLMLTDMEDQGSERPFSGQKRKGQSISKAMEGKGTCGRRQPVGSLQVHTLEHPRQ